MSDYFFFDDEEEGDYDEVTTGYELKYPNPVVTQAYMFSLEYRYPREYYDFIEDIEINGMMIANYYLIDWIHVVDAMRAGMLRPVLSESPSGDIQIYCQYWSPLEHSYKDFSDMSTAEIEWLHMGLVGRVWSYN